jgi:endonuclease/exonuclease/phosphatase family metal-dependent hydrolase
MIRAAILFLISFRSVFAGGDILKVMTYNLQGMKPGSEPEVRILHIIQNIIELDPDIIGLQEINESLSGGGADNQAKIIADSLSSHFGIPYYCYYEFTHLAWYEEYREFVGIISKYPVEETGFYQLVQGVFPRKVVWNKINTPLGTVNIFNTHLSAFNLSQIRIQQVQQIISYVEDIESYHPAAASILTGDFNDTPDATSIQQLTTFGCDTFYVISYTYANPTNPGFTVPSDQPTSKIDYVFIKNTGSIEPYESAVVMKHPYAPNKYCSDHLGVLTSFRDGLMNIQNHNFNPHGYLELYKNYPNPFNPSTKIGWHSTLGSHQSIRIYDILGNEQAILFEGYVPAGSYEIEFSTGHESIPLLQSGVYFYKLTSGNYTETKKMLFLK